MSDFDEEERINQTLLDGVTEDDQPKGDLGQPEKVI